MMIHLCTSFLGTLAIVLVNVVPNFIKGQITKYLQCVLVLFYIFGCSKAAVNDVVTATQNLILFLLSLNMEIVSIDSSGNDKDDDNTSLYLLFKTNKLKMDNNDDNFDEEGDDTSDILPEMILPLFKRKTK